MLLNKRASGFYVFQLYFERIVSNGILMPVAFFRLSLFLVTKEISFLTALASQLYHVETPGFLVLFPLSLKLS